LEICEIQNRPQGLQPGRHPRPEYLTKSEAPDDVVAVARALMGLEWRE
jgi:hypothetical protein